jgi:DNA-binding XRE family transcriptional regulator
VNLTRLPAVPGTAYQTNPAFETPRSRDTPPRGCSDERHWQGPERGLDPAPAFKPRVRIYLREWRSVRGMTQEELATLVGASKTLISRYENQVTRPPMLTYLRMLQALRITPDDGYLPVPSEPDWETQARKARAFWKEVYK